MAATSDLKGDFDLSSATLFATGTVTTEGNTSWTSGTIAGAGGLTNKGTMTAASGSDKTLSQTTLTNDGTFVHTGGRVGESQSSIVNQAGAVYNFQGDGQQIANFSGQLGIQNSGTIEKTAGTGTSTISVAFNNQSRYRPSSTC